MATSRSLGSFSRRVAVVADGVAANARKIVRAAAVACDASVVMGTPVDMGRARANWLVSMGAPRADELDAVDKSGQPTIDAGGSVIATYDGDVDIFIANNVPYIMPLENGHSQQAPYGMAKQAVEAGQAAAKSRALLRE